MKLIKFLVILFAVIGVLSVSVYAFNNFAKKNNVITGVLSEYQKNSSLTQNENEEPQNDGNLQDSIVIPTLRESIKLPATELVDCWKTADDGSYQYNFGQISREDCVNKINALRKEWEKTFSDTTDKQADMNDKSSLIVPQELEFKSN